MGSKCNIWKTDGYGSNAAHNGTVRPILLLNEENGEQFDALKESKVFIGIWSVEIIRPMDPHIHDTEEWWYMLEGRAFAKIGDENQKEIEPGTLMFMPPNVPHSVRPIAKTACRFLVFATPSELSEKAKQKALESQKKLMEGDISHPIV